MKGIAARDISYTALAAASLSAVKFALSWLANVELVTLLLVFYTLKLGKNKTFMACNVFIIVECFLYGFGVWVISYFIHWNFLVLVIWLMDKKGVKKSIYFALSALGTTFLFGAQTTFFEVLFYSANAEFFSTFALRYFMGITFFVTHMASAFLSVLFLLPPLLKIPLSDKG